jgi:hypothetical protein
MYQFQKKYCSLLVVSLLILSSAPAFAYIEPGTGNLVLQLMFGGIAGVSLLFKLYWRKLVEALHHIKQACKTNNPRRESFQKPEDD